MRAYLYRLRLDPDLANHLKGSPTVGADPEWELKQCLYQNVAGALLQWETGSEPSMVAVQTLAHRLRAQMHTQALAARCALGPGHPTMSGAEADVRIFCHDMLFCEHDKDYRCFAAFPLPELATFALRVLRVHYYGRAQLGSIIGCSMAAPQTATSGSGSVGDTCGP